jgi:hypothetical protein
MKRTITVKAQISHLEDEDLKELAAYCRDALESWGGQRRPDDWLFGGVKVKSVQIGKKRFTNVEIDDRSE